MVIPPDIHHSIVHAVAWFRCMATTLPVERQDAPGLPFPPDGTLIGAR